MASEAPAAKAVTDDAMTRLGKQFPGLSTGDRAELRRMYLTRRPNADGVVLGLLHRTGVDLDHLARTPGAIGRWKLVTHVAALLSGTAGGNPHAGRRLGEALQDAGYSEHRLMRLTSARGEALRGQIIRAARTIASAGTTAINLWSIFDLAGPDPDRADAARIRIAKGYYAADARSKGDSN